MTARSPKPIYHSCDLCYKENPAPGKNIVNFKYRKVDKVVSATMEICPECAATYESIRGKHE